MNPEPLAHIDFLLNDRAIHRRGCCGWLVSAAGGHGSAVSGSEGDTERRLVRVVVIDGVGRRVGCQEAGIAAGESAVERTGEVHRCTRGVALNGGLQRHTSFSAGS